MLSHSEVNRGAVEIFSVDDDPVNQVTSPQTRHVPIHQRTPAYQTRHVPANYFQQVMSPPFEPIIQAPRPPSPRRAQANLSQTAYAHGAAPPIRNRPW